MFAALIFLIAPAQAEETTARAALAAALTSAAREADTAPRMAFTETVSEKGVIVAGRFDPRLAPGHLWTPVGVVAKSGQEQESYRSIVHDTPDERDLLLGKIPATITGQGRLMSEANGVALFDFAMSPAAHPTNSPLDSALQLSNHIRVQLSVDEASQRLTGMRFYAPAPFSATPLARVDRVDLRFSFGASFPGGPTVVRQVDTDAHYRIVGVGNVMRDTVWFSDVVPILSCDCTILRR
ncbi:MAG TPA: hypothetical protein VG735_16210 [Caulobacterales bacterium]|nr:hypothetical protein [Caulobacterales bacterium]